MPSWAGEKVKIRSKDAVLGRGKGENQEQRSCTFRGRGLLMTYWQTSSSLVRLNSFLKVLVKTTVKRPIQLIYNFTLAIVVATNN